MLVRAFAGRAPVLDAYRHWRVGLQRISFLFTTRDRMFVE